MKSALQEAEENEEVEDDNGKLRLKDAKGRDILTPDERAKKEEKDRIKAEKAKQKAAEVSTLFHVTSAVLKPCRKQPLGLSESINWWRILCASSEFLQNLLLDPTIPMFRVVGGR
jgi:hypothetical protein